MYVYSNASSYWGQRCFNFISVLSFLNNFIYFLDEDFPQLCQSLFHLQHKNIFKNRNRKLQLKTLTTRKLTFKLKFIYYNTTLCCLFNSCKTKLKSGCTAHNLDIFSWRNFNAVKYYNYTIVFPAIASSSYMKQRHMMVSQTIMLFKFAWRYKQLL